MNYLGVVFGCPANHLDRVFRSEPQSRGLVRLAYGEDGGLVDPMYLGM